MVVTLKTLFRRWALTTLFAVAAFAVLVYFDTRLKAATGYGTRDLQSAQTAMDFKRVFAAWIAREHSATAGFNLGFDYLFMPLYGFAFYYSGIIAREAFTPKKGLFRRLMNYLSVVPLVGAFADAVENALEFSMMTSGARDDLAQLAFTATSAKTICFYAGLILLAAGTAGFFRLPGTKKKEAE